MPDAPAWHTIDVARVVRELSSDATRGLTSAEARRRLLEHGPNALPVTRRRSPIRLFASQFADFLVLTLIAAAIVSVFIGEPADVVAIGAIVVLNATLGFFQEYRAERAMEALQALAAPSARVLRDDEEVSIPSSDVVPGDIVLLDAGVVVPADVRLLDASGLAVDEASLTGESLPVHKLTTPLSEAQLPIADRRNIAYKGTAVSIGRATGIVVATGANTELGRIAALLGAQDSGPTPLQRRLARFGRDLAIVALALCAIIFVMGLLRGEPMVSMLMTALSLAVSAIPEAMPAVVTVSLALGARRMARQHALIRRLPAVETLGSVTVICSDKTGTLTENRMQVTAIEPSDDSARATLLDAIALNNDATDDGDGELRGDPTETALYRAAADAGHARAMMEAAAPRVAEIPFSSERARMTTMHERDGAIVAYTKGSPERVLAGCTHRRAAGIDEPLDQQAALARAEAMAASGLRVLAFATRALAALPTRLEDAEEHQVFLGFVGLQDPPRPEAREAVAICHTAGIRVVMITGDHPATARAIAERIGIASPADQLVTGQELARMSDDDLAARVSHIRLFARVAPEDKIRIVRALQSHGDFVAMTGDGVNDAPALRRAEIGVAMGKMGTDVAREAAHMVLLDDNFATIVVAVAEGRRIYDNIRRFIRYILSTNSGELWTLLLAPLVGLPLPLLPVQILWLNLVTDGFPGLALAAEPPERDIMRQPPRPPGESIFAHGLWQHVVWVGLLMAALTLGTQAWSISRGAHGLSMTFTVLTFASLAHALAIRAPRERKSGASHLPLLAAVALTFVAQLSVLYVPPLRAVLRVAPLNALELALCVAIASIVFFAVELEKWMRRRGWLYR